MAGSCGLSCPARRWGKGGCSRTPLLARGSVPPRECNAGGIAGRHGQHTAPHRSVRQLGKEAAASDHGKGGPAESYERTAPGATKSNESTAASRTFTKDLLPHLNHYRFPHFRHNLHLVDIK